VRLRVEECCCCVRGAGRGDCTMDIKEAEWEGKEAKWRKPGLCFVDIVKPRTKALPAWMG